MVTLEDFFELFEDGPEYDPHASWEPVKLVRLLTGMSESGFNKLRDRFGNRYEHRAGNRTLIYTPLFLRAYGIEKQQNKDRTKRGNYGANRGRQSRRATE